MSACQENEAVTDDAQGEVKQGLLMVLWQGRVLSAYRGMRYLGHSDKLLISLEGEKLPVDEDCLAVCEDEPAIHDFLNSSVLVQVHLKNLVILDKLLDLLGIIPNEQALDAEEVLG